MRALCLKLTVVVAILFSGACAPSTPAAAPPTTAPPTPTAVPPSPTPDPAAPVKAWVAAINSGDADAALALFDDKSSFTVFEYYASKKDQLRSIFDWFAGLETKYQITECQPDGGTVRCTLPVVDACIAASGATGGLPTKMAFTIGQDGKIQKVIGGLEGSGWNDYFNKYVYPAISWQRTNSPEEFKKVDSLADRREAGVINSKLCRAYSESLKVTPAPTAVPPTATAAPPTLTPATAATVKGFVTAINSGDVSGALALFDDKLNFMFGDATASNKEQLRSIHDWLAGLETRLLVKDCQPRQDVVLCTGSWGNACIAASGTASGAPINLVFTIGHDGKIQKLTCAPSGMEWNDPVEFLYAESLWQQASSAGDDKKVKTLEDRREAGALQARLCRAYAESLKVTPTPTAAPPTLTPATDASVKALVKAINSGDVSGALALFDDKLNFMMGGDYTASNKEQLRSIFDWFAGLEAKLLVKDCQPRQDIVLCTGSWGDACIVASGATTGGPINLVFAVGRDGKIQKFTGALSGMEWNDYFEFVNAESLWQQANFADDHKRVGTLEDRREAGAIRSRLCRAYADSLK